MKGRTYIVLVNWNGWSDTVECLESVFRLDDDNFAVVVVDNGSSDDSANRIISWAEGSLDSSPSGTSPEFARFASPCEKPLTTAVYHQRHADSFAAEKTAARLTIVCCPENKGFAAANNVGIRFALAHTDAARVWLLNNDTVVHPQALSAIIRRMSDEPQGGICGSTLLFYDRPDRVQARGGGRYLPLLGLSWHIGFMKKTKTVPAPERSEMLMNYVVGASLCASREFLLDVGLMSEEYFLFFEEVDWSYRNKGRYKLLYAPESVVYHKVGRSIGTSSNPLKKSNICDYYNLRNRLLFTRKHAPWALPGVYSVLVLAIVLRYCLGRTEQARVALRILTGCSDVGAAGISS